MTSEKIWLRSELMGTQVITRDTGRRLGVVGEVLVDVDRREVIAVGLRDNVLTRYLPGLPRYMLLESIRQVGDVILVDNSDAIEDDFYPERYTTLINCEVVTEAGEPLGRVRGFSLNIETGELVSLNVGALGIPLLPEGVISTYELGVEEIVSSGPDRIIVFEGAEERLKQVSVGLLEKLGIGAPPWEKDEYDRYITPTTPVENQLGPGEPIAPPRQEQYGQPIRARREDRWRDEEEYLEPVRQAAPPRAKRMYYDEDQTPPPRRYEDRYENLDDRDSPDVHRRASEDRPERDRRTEAGIERRPPEVPQEVPLERTNLSQSDKSALPLDDPSADVWADATPVAEPAYQPQELKLPQKQKQPEYEET
jgi:sporulation protein YlmC with PRC-barrel domain